MSNHCEHCHPDCQGGRSISVDDPSIIGHDSANEEWAATWMVCPACAEREQIEWLLDDLADYADDHGQIGRRNILNGVRRQIQDGVHRNGGDV